MATNELIVISQELIQEDMSPKDLKALAEQKATEILQKINDTSIRIAEAKENAKAAQEMKAGGFFGGRTKKKLEATSNAVVKTNEAVSELNNLVQESVRFTCASIQFAQVMHKTMAHLLVKGFKDTDGNIQKLSGSSKEAVETIMAEAEDFVQKQLAVEKKQAEMQSKLDEREKVAEEHKSRLNDLNSLIKDIQKIEQEHEKLIKELLEDMIESKKINQEQNSEFEKIHAVHSEHGTSINKLFEAIKENEVLDKNQNDEIQKMQAGKKLDKILKLASIVLGVIAIAISVFLLIRTIF
jgi:DNA repair exonuclease SbcCD ATPase subunit